MEPREVTDPGVDVVGRLSRVESKLDGVSDSVSEIRLRVERSDEVLRALEKNTERMATASIRLSEINERREQREAAEALEAAETRREWRQFFANNWVKMALLFILLFAPQLIPVALQVWKASP